jgi:hypothetical protein
MSSTLAGFTRPALLACAALLASGCAGTLYLPANRDLNDADVSGCDRQAMDDALVKSCRRLGEGSPVKSAAPFFAVTRRTAVSDPYKLVEKPNLAAQFFFELTPLGLFAPLFDYPLRETVYTGRVELSVTPADAAARVASNFEFRVKAGETFTKTLEFNKSPGLESGAPAAKYTPDAVTIEVSCRARGCALSSTPPLVNPDGSIRLQPANPARP